MRTIVHLSDLHFGRVHPPVRQPLIQAVSALQPDLVAVSGDLTQRARVEQFREARSFLDALPGPQIIVPGNHDVPLFNPLLRFLQPLSRFQRYITNDLAPMYLDDEIAVLGVNTARALAIKGGRVNSRQVAGVYEQFYRLQGRQTKVIVTHHPFDAPEEFASIGLVGRARMAMADFGKCGVDLFLAGHLHVTHAGNTARYKIQGYFALVIQAGTATSTRGRGELNAFNLIRIAPPQITVETHTWQPDRHGFEISQARHFRRSKDGWLSI